MAIENLELAGNDDWRNAISVDEPATTSGDTGNDDEENRSGGRNDSGGNNGGDGEFNFTVPPAGGTRRGRPRGSAGPRKPRAKKATLDIEGLATLIYMAHLGLAQRAPQFVLTGEESTELATRIANVLRHFDNLPAIPPWMIDAGFLAGTAARIYIPRLYPRAADMFGGETIDEGKKE